MIHIVNYIKQYPLIIAVLVLAFFFHMAIIIPSGSNYCIDGACGTYFWGVHSHDSIWHISLAEVAFRKIPFISPIYAGASLGGYNMLLDLVIFLLSKIGVSPLVAFFKILPLVWFVLFSYATISLSKTIHKSWGYVLSLLIFMFFGGSFFYFITLYHSGSISGSGSMSAMQSGIMMTNLQLAFSFVLLMAQLALVYKKKWSYGVIILLAFLTSVQFALKFYGGIISVFLLGFYLFEYLAKTKKFTRFISYSLISSLMVLLTFYLFYDPFTTLKSDSGFVFSPFSTVRAIIEEPTMFYLPDMVNARYYLQSVNSLSPRLLMIEIFSAFLYVAFNLGTRFFGIAYVLIKYMKNKTLDRFYAYLFLIIIFSTLLNILFIQKGIWWNTVQFFYYAIFLSNFFGAYLLYSLFSSRKMLGQIIGVILLVLTIPVNIDYINTFLQKPSAHISNVELEGLSLLKERKEGVVFGAFHIIDGKQLSPLSESSYISAFSGKQEYIADETQLELTRIDYKERKTKVRNMDCSFLEEVDYIYYNHKYSRDLFTRCAKELDRFTKIFHKEDIQIYEKI